MWVPLLPFFERLWIIAYGEIILAAKKKTLVQIGRLYNKLRVLDRETNVNFHLEEINKSSKT